MGGNNDPDGVPVDGLIDAVNAVLKREGKTLATYGLASGPQGYRPLREFIAAKLKRDAAIDCGADDILIVSVRCRRSTSSTPPCWRAAIPSSPSRTPIRAR